ncbi:MAG: cobalamin B12-binding domain-containing protein [Anaerolineaceae bacterium]|nr:cobalamin B12-binding domain-containing protein [Anaerolineaceae bacterium]
MDDVERYFDINTIFEEVLYPALVLIGDAWYRGDIRIATEHFASGFVRGRLLRIFQSIPMRREGTSILVGCAPEETHEIASLMFAILLRQEGYTVEYLGPDLPVQDLVDYSTAVKPKMICLSVSSDESAGFLKELAEQLSNLRSKPRLVYGGRFFNENVEARTSLGGTYLGANLSEGIQRIKEILPVA